MPKSLEDLRKEVAELEKQEKEAEEYQRLLSRKKVLEEKGTIKGKVKDNLKKLRNHLREKGQSFSDSGDRLAGKTNKQEEQGGFFDTPISRMSKDSEWKSPLANDLYLKKEKK